MGLVREVRVRPGHGLEYPEVRPGGWEPAAAAAQRVADRIVAQQGYIALARLKGRVLPESDFEFQGGYPNDIRPGGRQTRLGDLMV